MHHYNQQEILSELNQVAQKYPQVTPFVTIYANEGYDKALDWIIQYQPTKWGVYRSCKGAEAVFKVLRKNKTLLPDINEMGDHFGKTPLHKAAIGRNVYVFERMIKYLGANAKLKDISGMTPERYMSHNKYLARPVTLYGQKPMLLVLLTIICCILLMR